MAVLDLKMEDIDGIDVLKVFKAMVPNMAVIMLTGHATVESAIEGMKLGAFDYLLKPADFDDLKAILAGARQKKEEQDERIRQAEARRLLRRGGNI